MRVNIIERKAQAVLVEWIDTLGPHRVIVPNTLLKTNGTQQAPHLSTIAAGQADIDYEALQMGIPYGATWEALIQPLVTSERIAQALRERGIWTFDDLRTHIPQARAALVDAYGLDLKNLLEGARRAEGG